MPMLRFSVVQDKLYAPGRDGSFVRSLFDPQRGTGLLLDIDDSSVDPLVSALDDHVGAGVDRLRADDPIVVMINASAASPPMGPKARNS